jgi:anhydro-N-acetylmuramic acid kinase
MIIHERLREIYSKPERRILGLMSGTSLDGLDIASCRIRGSGRQTLVTMEHFMTIPYPDDLRNHLLKVCSVPVVEMVDLTLLHTELGQWYGRRILEALDEWGLHTTQVDAVASHGQTAFHAPKSFHGHEERPHATLQIGDGDHIATISGILTISDFRQKFTAAGGEGAPLVPFVEELMFRADRGRIMLNIGGIANYTYLPPLGTDEERKAADTGPGNTLIDALVRRHYPGSRYDEAGAIGGSVEPDMVLLEALLEDDWIKDREGSSTGPEHFNPNWMQNIAASAQLDMPDPAVQVATATWLTAICIERALRRDLGEMEGMEMYLSGGGVHNATLVHALGSRLPEVDMMPLTQLGWNADAKEAVVFALLANEFLAGEGFVWEGHRIRFGKLSLP